MSKYKPQRVTKKQNHDQEMVRGPSGFKTQLLMFTLLGINLIAFLLHIFYLGKNAINIPIMDEWEFFNPNQLTSVFSLNWLFAQHNEHRIVFVKLLGYCLYHINGWNVVNNQIFSFFVYGVVCVEILWLIWKNSVHISHFFIVAAISPILFSTINWENHSQFFNIPFHLFVLFFIPACHLLLSQPTNWLRASLGGLCCLFTIFSFTSGVVCVIALMVVMVCLPQFRKRYKNWVALIPSLIAILAWFIYHRPPHNHPIEIFPWKLDFWRSFLGMFSGALGIGTQEVIFGFIYFSLAILPLSLILLKQVFRFNLPKLEDFEKDYGVQNGFWVIQTILAGLISSVALTAVGRAGFDPYWTTHISRYSETILFMTPFIVFSLLQLPSSIKKLKSSAVFMILIFSGIGLSNSFRLEGYESIYQAKTLGIKCMCEFLKQGGTALCPTIYPGDMTVKLKTVKSLGATFIQEDQCATFDND